MLIRTLNFPDNGPWLQLVSSGNPKDIICWIACVATLEKAERIKNADSSTARPLFNRYNNPSSVILKKINDKRFQHRFQNIPAIHSPQFPSILNYVRPLINFQLS